MATTTLLGKLAWERLDDAVVRMATVNMGVKPGERVLVVTDTPGPAQWALLPLSELAATVEGALLARYVAEVLQRALPQCPVRYWAYPSPGVPGAEPDEETASQLAGADVVLAIGTCSISHTSARENASRAGVRVASMPRFRPEYLAPGGPMDADYNEVAREAEKVAKALTDAGHARVTSRDGTDLSVSLRGRTALADTGLFHSPGAFGNLPAGEAYVAPLEGTGSGRVVVRRETLSDLSDDMVLEFEGGRVSAVSGGGAYGDRLRRFLFCGEAALGMARRNLAELGVGTNPRRKPIGNPFESEKLRGTAHVGLGDNSHFGGCVTAGFHYDFVVAEPDLVLDGTEVIARGVLVI